jgi:hypothetical protein
MRIERDLRCAEAGAAIGRGSRSCAGGAATRASPTLIMVLVVTEQLDHEVVALDVVVDDGAVVGGAQCSST